MSFPVNITVNVDQEILDEYIEHVKSFNHHFPKRHVRESYRNKAMEHYEKMQRKYSE